MTVMSTESWQSHNQENRGSDNWMQLPRLVREHQQKRLVILNEVKNLMWAKNEILRPPSADSE
jgi:hypothetical protein